MTKIIVLQLFILILFTAGLFQTLVHIANALDHMR